MAMRYKGEKQITAMVCGIALICVIFPIFLIAIIPVAIIGVVAAINKHKNDIIHNKAIEYLLELDQLPNLEFNAKVIQVIKTAKELGNPIIIDSENDSIKYYQSIDNIGIAVIRKDFSTQFKGDQVVITNRYLTPKAREFCANGMIKVINRDELIALLNYIEKAKK